MDGEEEDEDEVDAPATPERTTEFVHGGDATRRFHSAVLKTASEWCDWQPDDPVRRLLKNAVESAQSQVHAY